MNERPGAVTFMGNPLTLLGPELKPGEKAPDFQVVDNDLKPVRSSPFGGSSGCTFFSPDGNSVQSEIQELPDKQGHSLRRPRGLTQALLLNQDYYLQT
jgi:hypothetical protein